MSLMTIAFEAGVVIVSAAVAAVISYLVFRKSEIALWAYVAAFIPRAILTILYLTGATNLDTFAWLSHIAGIFIFPMLLALGNILLIEVALAKNVKRDSSLPLDVRRAVRIEKLLGRLQHRKLLPKAAGVKEVYLAASLAGAINLIFVLGFGLL